MSNKNRPFKQSHISIEIGKDGEQYAGTIHLPETATSFPLNQVKLDKTDEPFGEGFPTLEGVIDDILEFNPDRMELYDESVQLELGMFFYRQTIGRLPESVQKELKATPIDLRIVTDDQWIAGLPWNVMAFQGIFLCATGWAVSICKEVKDFEPELPPCPRILMVAPQPVGVETTKAKEHIEDLEDMLATVDLRLASGNNWRVVYTWEDFVGSTVEFKPEIVYYYGHGMGDRRQTRLVFAHGKNFERVEKPIFDFANCLRKMEKPPVLVHLNCCSGDSGGLLGAGMQLGDFVPAVITNRTVAYVETAQSQAMALWKNILLRAVPPHRAVAELYANMEDHRLTVADIRWITPVIHCHYTKWYSKRPTPADRFTDDPHWHLKIDRVPQYNSVIAQTRLMLRERKPKSLAFVWYGEKDQGIEVFHRRLWRELNEDLTDTFVMQIRPAWPMHLADPHISFRDMLTESFGVRSLDDIPARIRAESQGLAGKQTLVYVRHEPLRSSRLINPKSLKTYVEWWEHNVSEMLPKNQFALLGISFMVKNPPAFQEYVEDEDIDGLDLKKTVFWLLDGMEEVAKKDLLLFLRTHSITMPLERRDKALKNILKKTGGRYEQTVEELKSLLRMAWQDEFADKRDEKTGRKKFDY